MRKVIITCAVTGGGAMTKNSKYVPVTPPDIAQECIAAAKAGAAWFIFMCGSGDRRAGNEARPLPRGRRADPRFRHRCSDQPHDGDGATYNPPIDDPARAKILPRHAGRACRPVVELRPDICSLDVATMNFDANPIVNSPDHLRYMAREIYGAGVKPELEVFDLGQIGLSLHLLQQGDLRQPAFFQFCLGIRGGAPATPKHCLR